tara:strand:+ start:7306 stop:7407 length:102 start_codon:yes stop_codon:yes gene_type:complete
MSIDVASSKREWGRANVAYNSPQTLKGENNGII